MLKAISLIFLFHNAENTIERAIRSLMAQTFKDVEYIFVNDGSTDRSLAIVEDLLETYHDFAESVLLFSNRFRMGRAAAYQCALKNASGIFLSRCDADDYLEPDALEKMYSHVIDSSTDVVWAPYFIEIDGQRPTKVSLAKKIRGLNDMPFDTVHFSQCNKLIRRSIMSDNGIEPLPGVNCWEDLAIVARVMAMKPTIKIIDTPVYHYVSYPDDGSKFYDKKDTKLSEHILCALLLEKWFIEHDGFEETYAPFLNHLKFLSKVKYLRGRGKDIAKWKSTFPETQKCIMSLRHVPIVYRILFLIVAKLPTPVSQAIADWCDRFYRK